MGSLLSVLLNSGALVAYIVGGYAPYHITPYVLITFPIFFLCALPFIPETPYFLLKKGKIEVSFEQCLYRFNIFFQDLFFHQASEKSLAFYENTSASKERFTSEMEKVRAYTAKKQMAAKEKVNWRQFCTPEARYGFQISFSLLFFGVFCGNIILTNYAASIFKQSGSKIDPHISSIIMMCIQVLGVSVASIFVDKLGRRSLLMLSTFGTALGMFCMASFNYLIHEGIDMTQFNWVPVISLSFSVFMASVGILPLYFVVLCEVLPMKVSII